MTFRRLIEGKKLHAYVDAGKHSYRLSSTFGLVTNVSVVSHKLSNLSFLLSPKDVKKEFPKMGNSDYVKYMKTRITAAASKSKNNADFAKNLNKEFNISDFKDSDKRFSDINEEKIEEKEVDLNESKKIQGIKGTLSKYEDFSGSLDVFISAGEDDDMNYESSINFSGSTWELKSFTISDSVSQSKLKSILKKDIENMLKKDYKKYFNEIEDDVWEVDKDSDYVIDAEKAQK